MAAFELMFAPTGAQLPPMLSSAENKCLGGQRGGGKSGFIGGKVVHTAHANPGCTFILIRNDLSDLKKTILLEVLGRLPGRQGEHWTHHKNDALIKVRSSVPHLWSSIYYIEGKDPNSFKGGNITGIFADEADEIPYATIAHLGGSLRQAYPEEIWHETNPLTSRPFGQFPTYEIALATNPSPCWIMDQFPVQPEEQAAYNEAYASDPSFDPFPSPLDNGKMIDPDFAYFPFRAEDNPYNPPGYKRRLERTYAHDPVLYARMVEGRWDANMQGLVYRLDRHNRWYSPDPGKRLLVEDFPVVLGIDPANGAGFYACVVLQFWKDRIFVVDEFVKEEGLDEDLIDWLDHQPYRERIVDAVYDHALPATGRRLRSLGLPARPCGLKDVIAQISSVSSAMRYDPDLGYSPLVIDERRCPHLRMEMGRRAFARADEPNGPVRPQPVRGFDDCCKALEYPVMERRPAQQASHSYRQPEQRRSYWQGQRPPQGPLNTTPARPRLVPAPASVGRIYRAPTARRT